MKYIKLVAKPNTWFKEGTEAYSYDCTEGDKKRITLEEYEQSWKPCGYILCTGIRVIENPKSEGGVVGEEHFDGEYCCFDEFDIEIVDAIA